MSAEIVAHPFLADLPVFEAEVAAIAESISEVGLLHPITLDADGRVIGGRHRLAACARADVTPSFETYDGDALAFILHDNATRKHQTTGQRAAENALALDAAGRREDGRWRRGTVANPDFGISKTEQNLVTQCGLVLDHLGRSVLIEVAMGDRTLNDAHVAAERARDAAHELLAEQERIEAEEAAALAALPEEYAKEIGVTYSSARVAFAAWEDANRAEAARLRKQRAAEEQAKRDRLDGIKRYAGYLEAWTAHYPSAIELRNHPERDDVLNAMSPKYRAEFLALEAANDWRIA